MKNVSRVKEQSSTAGLSSYQLASSGSLYRRFRDEFASGERVRYYAASAADFEEGLGVLTYGTPDTLSRDVILRSSQSGAKINWPAGTRDLFVDPLPGTVPVQDKSGAYTVVFTDHGTLIRFTGASGETLSLTAAASLGDGFSFEVFNSGTADYTIDPNGAETINGGTTLAIAPGRGVLVRCTGTAFFAQPTGAPSSAAVIASARNLIGAWASVSTLTITADELILKDASGGVYLASSVNVTANIATSGANGLDTGTEAASTWYYVWIIYNGTTVAALLSTSSTAPTLPSGYTYRALVGVVRNDASSNFVRFRQTDRLIRTATVNVFTAKAAAVANTYETLAGADLTAFQGAVPPIAKAWHGIAGNTTNTGSSAFAIAGDANGVGEIILAGQSRTAAAYNYTFAGPVSDMPIVTSQQFAWKREDTSAAGRVDVTGYNI